VRFDAVPHGLRQALAAIDEKAKLRALLRAAIQAATLEDFPAKL
jgi:hypothetical protein